MRIPRPCLMLITDRTLLTANWTLAQAVAPAVTGGVNLVVLGEADLPRIPRLTVARFVLDGIRDRVPMLTSGDPQFALDSGAAGALIENPADLATTGEMFDLRVLGVALTTPEMIVQAEAARADFGLLNLDWSLPDQAFVMIQRYSGMTEIPLIAGVDMSPDEARRCVDSGASGVAICGPAMSAYNRTEAVRAYATSLGMEVA